MKKLRLLTSHALSNKMLIPGIVFIFLESVRQAQYMWFKKKNMKVWYYNLQELNWFVIFLVIPLSSVWIYYSFSMGLQW